VFADSISYNNFCDIMRKEKPTSREALLKAFKKIDVNGDGYITYEELSKLLTMVRLKLVTKFTEHA
jgi:Ca2+-binding EF-hand superfamily protein